MKKKITGLALGLIMALTIALSSNSNALPKYAKSEPGTQSALLRVSEPGTGGAI